MHRQPGVHVDRRALEQRFKALQRKLHPDLFAQRSPVRSFHCLDFPSFWRLRLFGRAQKEQEISAETSPLINPAYQTLGDPVTRIEYLVTRRRICRHQTF